MNSNYVAIDGPDIPGPRDAASTGTNCSITTLSMDMIDSTSQRYSKSIMSSNTEFMKMYDVWSKHLDAAPFKFVEKFSGDGLHITADSMHAGEVINLAMAMLHEFEKLGATVGGQPMGEIDFQVRAGIATGPAFRFRPKHGGNVDHLSSVCDRSARLCSVASAQALFVDPHTVNAANMTQVTSPLGDMLNRAPDDYLGDKQSVQLKGIPEPVPYFELLWSKGRFGVRSSVVTEISSTPTPPPGAPSPSAARSSAGSDQLVGTTKVWMSDRGYGFVTGHDGEDFHVSSRALLYGEDAEHLRTGARVVFLPADAAEAGKSRRAFSVVLVGQEAEGRVSFIHAEKPFGFIAVGDDHGRELRFHMVVDAALRTALKAGDEVGFQVDLDASGTRARAINVGKLGEGDLAVA